MKNSRIIFSALALYLLASQTAHAGADPMGYRRTLFMTLEQKKLVLEAPPGMCFLDPSSSPADARAMADAEQVVNAPGTEVLLAVFAPCLAIAEATKGTTPPDTVGFITWLKPSTRTRNAMHPGEYVSAEADRYKGYVEKSLTGTGAKTTSSKHGLFVLPPSKNYKLDKMPKVDSNTVSIGYTAAFEHDFEKYRVNGISATALLGGLPIGITLRTTNGPDPFLAPAPLPSEIETMYKTLHLFLAQERALNP